MSDVRLGTGGELSITPSSGTAPATDPTPSYSASATQVWLGGSDWIADITADIIGLQLAGQVNAPRNNRATAPSGLLGPSADALRASRSASIQARLSDSVATVVGRQSAVLWIERASWVDAIPVVISAAPIQSPRTGIQAIALGLVQAQDALACSAAPATSGSQKTSSGIIGYQRTTSKIAPLTATAVTASAAAPVARGAPANANNTAPNSNVGLTAMGGTARGLESFTRGLTSRPREVPGGAQIGHAQPRFANFDFALVCDSNSIHDYVLRDANGTRRRFQALLRAKSGDPQYAGEAILRTTLGLDMSTDRARWAVALLTDGRPTESSQT